MYHLTYNVEKVELLDSSDFTYSITLESRHYLKIGNSITIILKNENQLDSNVIGIDNEKSLRVRGQGVLDTINGVSHIQRKIQKGESNTFSDISSFLLELITYIKMMMMIILLHHHLFQRIMLNQLK